MPCCASLFSWLNRRFFAVCLLLLAVVAPPAAAAGIEVRNAQLTAVDDGYAASADFNIEFNPRLEEAVTKGVILYFVADFELSRVRWFWLDEKLVSRSQTFRLSYHALTRQYRLSSGALHQSFDTLYEALRILSRLRNWTVIERGTVRVEETYLASLRLRLDLTQMPKTFQVSALANRDWNLSSEWARWSFSPGEIRVGAFEAR